MAVPALAADSPSPTAGVQATTLENGLRVLLLEDHRSPIVTVQTWYRVGSRNEHRGATGIAHFLEHMMFKGTPNHGPREFARLVEQNGGQDNAFTSQDVTSYYVNLVADKLDLVLDLEADRMHNLLLDAKEIDSERQVVIEERRTRTEDDPEGFLAEEVSSIAFKAHPYSNPIIGWSEDLRRITPAEIRAFYKTYYNPNNAILVVVGDFKADEALGKIKARLGRVPRAPDPPPVLAVEPPQNGERRVIVKKQAQLPVVHLAWHVPNQKSDDAAALELLSTVLSGGRASRLYRHLVYPETLEKVLLEEMEQLKQQPVTEEELTRAKNQIEAEFVFQQDSIHRRASLLARFETIGGYKLEDSFISRIRAVTAADIQRVARTWFPTDKKNVGILLPQP
ncbi:MAG: insulinase family protein [Candidatus Rokuibacteriota bacterium]|nr:MAG: insulinase family protein [Candidatus Rokubacteria bacterium]